MPDNEPTSKGVPITSRVRGRAGINAAASDDAHEILGVRRGATAREVRAAYLRLVKELHPDGRTPASDAHEGAERLKAINAAYRKLKAGGAGHRGWTRAGSAIFAGGILISAAPLLMLLGAYHAGWLRPQTAVPGVAPLRESSSVAGTGSVHRKDGAVGRQMAFADAKALATKEAWAQFLAAYPDGDTAEQARQAIAAIERRQAAEARKAAERTAWVAAQKRTKPELQRFLAAYPDGERAGDAKQALARIERVEARRRREQAAWIAAEGSGTREDLQRFMDDHPGSAEVGQAKQALAADARVGIGELERRDVVVQQARMQTEAADAADEPFVGADGRIRR